MKKLLTSCLVAAGLLAGTQSASAQKVEEFGIFDHLSVGLTAGLGGVGIDVGSCVTEYLQVRVGAQLFPKVKYEAEFSPVELVPGAATLLNQADIPSPEKVNIEAKLGFSSGKVLVDAFPFPKSSSFHVTAGFYFGGGDIITLRNTEDGVFSHPSYSYPDLGPAYQTFGGVDYDPAKKNEPMYGIKLGDYKLEPDNGNLEAGIHVNNFRPYLGIGFGRAVPRNRLGFMFELGVQFWGSPTIYIEGGQGRHDVTEKDFTDNGANDGGLTKTLHEINVYPMMTFRLCGRIL